MQIVYMMHYKKHLRKGLIPNKVGECSMLDNTIKQLVNALDCYYKDNLIDGVSTDTHGSNYVVAVDYSVESVKCTMTDGTMTLDATLYYSDRKCNLYVRGYRDGYDTSKLDTIITEICDVKEVLQRESDVEVIVTLV